MNRKKFRATEEQPMDPIGSQQHKSFIAGFLPEDVGTMSDRDKIYDELSKEEQPGAFFPRAKDCLSWEKGERPLDTKLDGYPEFVMAADKIAAKLMASSRHPDSQRFHQLLEEIGKMHDSKQGDYGLPDAPFNNLAAAGEWGLSPWLGIMIRISDKIRRLQTFQRTGKLNHESMSDSLKDIAVYSLAALVLLEKEDKNKGLSFSERMEKYFHEESRNTEDRT